MPQRTHYSRAPIIQALIDIQVKSDAWVDLATLSAPLAEIRTDYPTCTPVFTGNATIQLVPSGTSKFDVSQIGYSHNGRSDHKYVFQARQEGLTVSRLAPYETWEKLRDEFLRIWRWYAGVVKPKEIMRLAVRYTNRFDFPLPFRDFKEYLSTTPEIGTGLPAELGGFVMQLQIPQPDLPGMIIVNEALVPPAREGVGSVLVDIDVFQTEKIPYNFSERLELLHDLENKFFEGSITDKARELIR